MSSQSTWSYSGNPGANLKDQVRFLIGDTDEADPLLLDTEIAWLLTQYNGALNTSVRACETIAAKFSRYCDESVGPVKMVYSQKAAGMLKLRDELQGRLSTEDMVPFAGGISKSQKVIQELNPDRVEPDFTKQMMDNRQVGPNEPDLGDVEMQGD